MARAYRSEVVFITKVERKKNESFEAMLRRFNQRVQKSGRLLQAKKIRFLAPSESKTKKKQAALKRKSISEKIDYQLRSGKLKEEDLKRRGKLKLKK